MKRNNVKIGIVMLLLIAAGTVSCLFISSKKKIDFNTQVKPLLNKKCIACHGGVKQSGDFSVLFREEALRKTKSGGIGIIPGNAAGSELIKRIKTNDPEERMPYKHDPLSKEEIAMLEQWIDDGAAWGKHWAYEPVQQPGIPNVNSDWIKNDLDHFVVKKLEEEKLYPSPVADKATLLRRVALDIIGLPADSVAAVTYLSSNNSKAYEELVDQLLASSAYGERWTSMWLDLARYGDTKGYESDQPREIWRYKDWLIKSFNADKPYDVFLIEQMAGDLMPDADDDQYIATAFHRNTMTNDEGGTDNEEFRIAAVMDRVNTTWSALLSTTFNCVQCHSHPYDPFKHEEYYRFMAFFNNTRDEDRDIEYPFLRHYSGTDSVKLLQLNNWLTRNAGEKDAQYFKHFLKTLQPIINSHLCDDYKAGVCFQNNYASLDNGGSMRLPNITNTGKPQFLFRYLSNKAAMLTVLADSLSGQVLATIPLTSTNSDWRIQTISLPELQGKRHLYFKYHAAITDKLPLLFDWFAFVPSFPGNGNLMQAEMKQHFYDLIAAKVATTPVLLENTPDQRRPTQVFDRGSWLSKGEVVEPGVPPVFNAMPKGAPNNRLGLAMWLTDKKNPLTARTIVNHLWEQLFGAGLVETLDDMGTQGATPVYKELLDYLSYKLMYDYKWSIKKLLKEMVLSATYQQSSIATKELLEKDPNNQLLARAARVRLTGEQLRDQALAVSGLLSKKMYGPGVMPWQPEGIWSSPYNPVQWKLSEGEDQFRRAVYTYWKRTAPYPSLMNFDGMSREVCAIKRIHTNTPLQALNTLNDSAYLQMAAQFALKMRSSATIPDAQIANGYRAMMYKPIAPAKLDAFKVLYEQAVNTFEKDKQALGKFAGNNGKILSKQDAAMCVVANAMMNIDEWVNKN